MSLVISSIFPILDVIIVNQRTHIHENATDNYAILLQTLRVSLHTARIKKVDTIKDAAWNYSCLHFNRSGETWKTSRNSSVFFAYSYHSEFSQGKSRLVVAEIIVNITGRRIFPHSSMFMFYFRLFVCLSFIFFIIYLGFLFQRGYSIRKYRLTSIGTPTLEIKRSYLQNGISYIGKTTSLYWIRAKYIDNETWDIKAHGRV